MEKSTIVQHCWAQGHQACFAETMVLYRSDNWHARLTRESLEIAFTKQALNQEKVASLSNVWLPLYSKLMGEGEEDQFDS